MQIRTGLREQRRRQLPMTFRPTNENWKRNPNPGNIWLEMVLLIEVA